MPRHCFGEEELVYLREVIESQELWRGVSGNMVARFEDALKERYGRPYAHGLSSGTAASVAVTERLTLELFSAMASTEKVLSCSGAVRSA